MNIIHFIIDSLFSCFLLPAESQFLYEGNQHRQQSRRTNSVSAEDGHPSEIGYGRERGYCGVSFLKINLSF